MAFGYYDELSNLTHEDFVRMWDKTTVEMTSFGPIWIICEAAKPKPKPSFWQSLKKWWNTL